MPLRNGRCAATVGRQDLRVTTRSATTAWRKRRDKRRFPVGASPTRLPLSRKQPSSLEVTKWLEA
jgi:hypothetical protein